MDFSVLADRRAPWHGYQGYVGSDNYRSPEHITRGAMPGLPSDVFTCGLILYELLAGTHPYWRDEQAEYAALVREHAAKPPALLGVMPSPATNAEVSAALHRCLSPDPALRPTAAELRAVLSGRGAKRDTAPASASGRPRGAVPSAGAAPAAAFACRGDCSWRRYRHGALRSSPTACSSSATAGARSRSACAPTSASTSCGSSARDAEFWDAEQCVVERLPDRRVAGDAGRRHRQRDADQWRGAHRAASRCARAT